MEIEIHNIENFDENAMSYQMRFLLKLFWIDNRLKFLNLKEEGEEGKTPNRVMIIREDNYFYVGIFNCKFFCASTIILLN